jgi:hypothetical protein
MNDAPSPAATGVPTGVKVWFTRHAICRFIERFAPDLEFGQADRALNEAAEHAVRLATKTERGDELWHLPTLGVTVVAKLEGQTLVCITILPEHQSGLSVVEFDLFTRYMEQIEERRIRAWNAVNEMRQRMGHPPLDPSKHPKLDGAIKRTQAVIAQVHTTPEPPRQSTLVKFYEPPPRREAEIIGHIELPPPTVKKPRPASSDDGEVEGEPTPDAELPTANDQTAANAELTRLKTEFKTASMEATAMATYAKVALHAITRDQDMANMRRALRLAIRSLVAANDYATLSKIGGGYTHREFYESGDADGWRRGEAPK